MENDMARLCHLKKWIDFDGYGFDLCGDRGKEGQKIGWLGHNSPADLGGLKIEDTIVEINGVNVLTESHKMVVEKIKSDPNEVKILVVSLAGWDYYVSKSILISSDLDFIKHFETPSKNPRLSSYYKNGSKKSQNHYTSSNEEPVRLCKLHRWHDLPGYGFNLQTLENKTGQYVGQVDQESPASSGGVKEGDRILSVNEVKVTNLGHKDVVDLIRSNPESVTLLVVDQVTDERYKVKGVILEMDGVKEGVSVIECSNPVSNPFASPESSASERAGNIGNLSNNHISNGNEETKFDDDEDDNNTNNNNNNTNNNNNNTITSDDYENNTITSDDNENNTITYDDNENNTNNNENNSGFISSKNLNTNSSSSSPQFVSPTQSSSSPQPLSPQFVSPTQSSSSPPPNPLTFSSSAKEARLKMTKKTKAGDASLTLKEKFQILQQL